MKPRIGKLSIYEVRRSHINKMLDEIEDANGPVMADRTLAYLRKAFNWYAARDDQFNVPACAVWRGSSLKDVPARASYPTTKSGSSGQHSARLEHSVHWSRRYCLRRSGGMRSPG